MREKFSRPGNPGAAEPEGRQSPGFNSLGRSRVIGAERKRMAKAKGQGDFLCAAKPHVGVESGTAAGHTNAGSMEAARAGWQRSHGRIGLSSSGGCRLACD